VHERALAGAGDPGDDDENPERDVDVNVLQVVRCRATAPAPLIEATLKENALGEPMCGCPSLLNRMRSMALASVNS
jgi:hypothetical protein